MTVKQVRDNFVQNLAENAYLGMCTVEEMNTVISALDKQIPAKPKIKRKQPHCPCCNTELDYEVYCYVCGQAMDWSDFE